MTDKTKEAIAEVLEDYQCGRVELTGQALAKICAIVETERAGEVVLWDGEILGNYVSICGPNFNELRKKKGRLIFQPEGEKSC
jgi:hypothetical protein